MPVASIVGPPAQIEAGNTFIFTDSFTDYPSDTWTAAFVIAREGGKAVAVSGTASGTGFSFTLPADLEPGVYQFAEYVTEIETSQRTTARTGALEVLPDLARGVAQSTAQKILAQLEDTITKLSGSQNISVSFNGQSFTKRDLASLTNQRTYWKAEVLREQARSDAQRGVRPQVTSPVFTTSRRIWRNWER